MKKRTTKTTRETRSRVKTGHFIGTKDRDMDKIWEASKIQRKRFSAGQKPAGKHKKGTNNSGVYKGKELAEYMRILNRQARRIEAAAARIEKSKKKKGRRK